MAAGRWSDEEMAFLEAQAEVHGFPWCAKQLGRTLEAVRLKASRSSIRSNLPTPGPPKLDEGSIRSGLAERGLTWVSGSYTGSISKTLFQLVR